MQTQRMYSDYNNNYHQEYNNNYHNELKRSNSVDFAENLADRVLKIGKTLMDLKRELVTEKELLEREKLINASMYLLPTSDEYYTLVYPNPNLEGEKPDPSYNFQNYVEDHGDDIRSCASSENLQETRRKLTNSQQEAYRKHLLDIQNKCKMELGAVKDSINSLKRVTTELHVEIHKDKRAIDKEFFYDEI